MSNNAIEAYNDGCMPISKWSKSAIIAAMHDAAYPEHCIAAAVKSTLRTLKSIVLCDAGWHHTSKHYNRTCFYAVENPFIYEDDEEIDEWLEKLGDAAKDAPKNEEENIRRVTAEYREWYGSRNHPKSYTVRETGIVKGNWFVGDETKKRKNINGNWFAIIEK